MVTDHLTKAEAKEFADKFEAFSKQLSPKEQHLLHEILLRAAAASEEDVRGYEAANGIATEVLRTILSSEA